MNSAWSYGDLIRNRSSPAKWQTVAEFARTGTRAESVPANPSSASVPSVDALGPSAPVKAPPLPRPSRYAKAGERIGYRLASFSAFIILINAINPIGARLPTDWLPHGLEDWVRTSSLGYNIYLVVVLAIINIALTTFFAGAGYIIGTIEDRLARQAEQASVPRRV